jgi:hypothetical protein
MAFMSQAKKAKIAAALKLVMPKGWKYSLAVRNHSSIVLTISAAPVDVVGEWFARVNAQRAERSDAPLPVRAYVQVNTHHIETQFEGERLDQMRAILAALNDGNWNRSDLQADLTDVGWYVDVHIGRYDRPFIVTGSAA